MNDTIFAKYLKLLSRTPLSSPFTGADKKLFDDISNDIKKEIVNQLKIIETIKGKDRYAMKLITSFYSIMNIYSENYIYIENDFEIEKKLKFHGEEYITFKIRTPDINSIPIYTIISIDEKREMITYTIESMNEDFTKIIIYEDNNKLYVEIFTQTAVFDDIFGKKYIIPKITKQKFLHFLESNLHFLESNNKSLNIAIA
jgi:hypothetical protein